MSFKIGVICIIVWIMLNQAISNFILSGVTFQWHAAMINERYSFASLYLNFEKSSIVDIGSILRDGDETWIGYFQMETTFEYYGCALINDRVPSQTLSKSWNTPGTCFSVCNGMAKKVFGLKDNKCFCLDDTPSTDIHKPECDNYYYTNWVAGGRDKYISLYRKIDIKETTPSTKDQCLTFFETRQHGQTQWNKCTGNYKCLCMKDGIGLPLQGDGRRWHYRWTEYVNKCFENGLSPVSYRDVLNSSLSFINATSYSWTNIIRSKAIFNNIEYINDKKAKEYAYIKKEGTQIFLLFTSDYRLFKQALFEISVTESTKTEMPISTPDTRRQNDFSVTVGASLAVLAVIIAIVAVAILAVKRFRMYNTCFKSVTSIKTLTSTSDLQ